MFSRSFGSLNQQVFHRFCTYQSFNREQKYQESLLAYHLNQNRWIHLLRTDVTWSDLQNRVNTAALLTSQVSKVGWYIQPLNTSKNALNSIDTFYKYYSQIQLKATTLDQLIQEFIDLTEKYKGFNRENLPKIESVHENVLKEANEFLATRGQLENWSASDYLEILNNNLRLITQNVTVESLPSNQDLSIELLYGYMISHYGIRFLNACPQLAVLMVTIPFVDATKDSFHEKLKYDEPKIAKLKSLTSKMSQMKNLPFKEDFFSLKFQNVFELSEYFKKQKKEIEMNFPKKEFSKKSYQRLNKLIRQIDKRVACKQDRFEIRLALVSEQQFINSDYRTFANKGWEVLFYEGLRQGLNKLQTDIFIFNNGTLRDPSKHLVTRFLNAESQLLREHIIEMQTLSEEKLVNLASIVRRARKQNYVVSDWQNKIARMWQGYRYQIIKYISYKNEQGVQTPFRIPPPFPYCLALDLNPESHPVSFTYSRQQGYCIGFEQSMGWFVNHCNRNEKAYFYSLLENPSCHSQFSYLQEIPEEIRRLPDVFNDSIDENNYLLRLDEWLVQNSQREDLQIIKHINSYINSKLEELPPFLSKKLEQVTLKKVSVISLFDQLFFTHFPEEVYLSVYVQLPYPKYRWKKTEGQISQEKKEKEHYSPIDPLVFNTTSELLSFWGPSQYGGQTTNRYDEFEEEEESEELY